MQNRRGRPGKLATAGEPGRTELLRLPDTQILDREGPAGGPPLGGQDEHRRIAARAETVRQAAAREAPQLETRYWATRSRQQRRCRAGSTRRRHPERTGSQIRTEDSTLNNEHNIWDGLASVTS